MSTFELELKAAEAPSEAEAVTILEKGGYPRDYAEEVAAIMFGSSKGDTIESNAPAQP